MKISGKIYRVSQCRSQEIDNTSFKAIHIIGQVVDCKENVSVPPAVEIADVPQPFVIKITINANQGLNL
jgi:hypothetical protein